MGKKINYQNIFDQLISEYPHNIDAIESLFNETKEKKFYLKFYSEDIICNKEWNAEEKAPPYN
jgi:hypothetical protein